MKVKKMAFKMIKRQHKKGKQKYQVTLDQANLTTVELLNHLAEEMADALQYACALIKLERKGR